MIVLDTNVVSALMQHRPVTKLFAWMNDQPADSLWITAITIYEIRFGIERLAPGKRRRALDEAFAALVKQDLGGRVLSFDEIAARTAGVLGAREESAGRPFDDRDIAIAGIVAARKATLATHNTRHFSGLGLRLVDPLA